MSQLKTRFLGVLLSLFAALALAQEPTLPEEEGLRLQLGDAVAPPIEPLRDRSDETSEQLNAMSWFGIAKLRESRGDFRGALDAYRKAVKLDPNRIAIYRGLVPLAFSLNETEEALTYAFKLVELDPQNAELMQQLARVLIGRGQISQAASLLEQASKSKTVSKTSPQYVALQKDLGILYSAQGEHKKAAEGFKVLLEALKSPKDYGLTERQRMALIADPETTFDRIGQTFLEAGQTDLAVDAFEQAAEARRGKPGVLQFDLARVYLKANEPEKALEQLNSYIDGKRTDRGRAAYDLLANVLEQLDRRDEFESRLRNIVETEPKNAFAKLVLADEVAKSDQLDEAAGLYEQAVESVSDPSSYLGLADIYRRQGKADQLVDLLARAAVAGASDEALGDSLSKVADDKKLVDTILERARQSAKAEAPKLDFASAFLLGKLAVEAEQIDDAKTFYEFAIRIRPDRAPALYEELGRTLLLADKYEEAVETYRQALQSPADDAARLNFMFRLSQALEFSGKTDEALATVDKALQAAPEAALLHYQRGWILFHAKQWDQAAEAFRGVIERFPNDEDTVRQSRLSLSALYVEQGDQAKGEQVLEDVYAADPDDPAVNNDLGYLYADQGKKLEQAEAMIRKALAAEPENAAYLDSMGWVLYRLGKYEEAVVHLEKAVSLPSGDDSTLWDHLGDVYDKLGKKDEARSAWQKALELAKEAESPKPEEVKAIEEKLSQAESAVP